MKSLDSSAIEAVGHDGQALVVRFTGGREYRYPTAGAEHVDAMAGADSAGRYFNEQIRQQHPHDPKR